MTITIIPYASEAYKAALEMRKRILCVPPGCEISPDETDGEEQDVHIAAFEDGRIVGALLLSRVNKLTCRIRQVAVEPNWQHRGVGRAMVQYAHGWCRQHQVYRIVCSARESAVDIYKSLGYRLCGEPSVKGGVLRTTMQKCRPALWQFPSATPSQMMGYVALGESGVVVIDGGTRGDARQLVGHIQMLGGSVDAWLLTHFHHDHTGALIETLRQGCIPVQNVFCNFPPLGWARLYEPQYAEDLDEIERALSGFEGRRLTRAGEAYCFDGIRIQALNDPDLSLTRNAGNNSTVVFKMSIGETDVLFLGDLGAEAGDKLLEQCGESLRAPVVQMAHHGQNGVREEFYRFLSPEVCLWPTPDWLWINDSGGGAGSGPWETLKTREWMSRLPVKQHLVSKDGLIEILSEISQWQVKL